ncbi:MAG: hypothetical protein ABEK02_06615 [Haloquadratum sp.]
MSEPLRIEAGELTGREILEVLQDGRRVVVTADVFGGTHELSLRHDGETYYCDTPTTLHKHPTEEEMLDCIEKMGYGRDA